MTTKTMSRAAREARVLDQLDRIRVEQPALYDELMVLLAQLVDVSRKRKGGR